MNKTIVSEVDSGLIGDKQLFGSTSPGPAPGENMVWIPGGMFRMGSDRHYPEESPVHKVTVDGFWIDRSPITNAEFARFVKETNYVTFAERAPDPEAYPGALPEMLKPGSLVFKKTQGPVDLHDPYNWWFFLFGADWRHPKGPHSDIKRHDRHPVVHVAYQDVEAYAQWAHKAIPTEAEWEFAARGGLELADFAWGDEFSPDGSIMANTWQGDFPWSNLLEDGYERTSPVCFYPPNGYGLFDMIGNVWEWTSDWYRPRHDSDSIKSCCIPQNPRVVLPDLSYDSCQNGPAIPRRVLKGGSHLCAPNYCRRYRPAARHPEPIDTSTGHVGFRCIVRPASASTPHSVERADGYDNGRAA